MATWYGEPYPGYFVDQTMRTMGSCTDPKLVEQYEIDPSWIMGHENECDLAKLNSEVLTIIHEEKRFPTKEEFAEIRVNSLPPMKMSFTELASKVIPLTWDEIDALDNKRQSCWGYIDNVNVDHYESLYYNEPMEPEEPCPWNGITYEDFIKNDPPKSALANTTGLNKHNLNHRLI